MTKITIILSLTILYLVFLSSTYGEDHWKEQIQKRLSRASGTDSSFRNNLFSRRKTTKTTRATTAGSTAKVTPATTASSSSSSFTTFQNQALAQTNKYRAAHCAPNLILDPKLNSIAQAYASKLVQIGYLVHSNNGYGENLYYINYGQPTNINSIRGSMPVDSWYSEVSQYNWASPGFSSSTGHFTQLVWISTKQMGIGIACTSDKTTCYIVANYSPPGNYDNEYQANVKKGPTC